MQGIFQKENTDKALKYGIYRHLPTYEKIIRNLVSFYYEKCHCFLSRHEKNRFLTKCRPICRTSIVYFHFYFLLPNDLLLFWHLHTQKQVHEQEAYAINVPFSVFVFFPNFIWNSSYLNIIFASCIKLFSYFGCQHCIKFFFLLQICCPFLCHSESIHSP